MITEENRNTVVMASNSRSNVISNQVNDSSDGVVSVLGLVEAHALDVTNKPVVEEAIARISNKERGSWVLCRALVKAEKEGDRPVPAENAGFIVFKDNVPRVLYSNNLTSTPSQQIMEPDEDAIRCVHGLVPMDSWLKGEPDDCSSAQIPAVVAAYNTLKAGVNRVEHINSNGVTGDGPFIVQRDVTILLDESAQNAVSFLRTPVPREKQPLMFKSRDFKQSICDMFAQAPGNLSMMPFRANNQQSLERSNILQPQVEHYLFESEGGRHSQCYLCKHLRTDGKRSSSIYSCSACQHAFHVNCFTMYHYYDKLRQDKPELFHAIKKLHVSHGRGQGKRRDRKFKRTVTFSSAKLPFDSKQQPKTPN